MTTQKDKWIEEKEKLAENLHKWYLEACQKPESGMDFNPAAQEPYEALKETQKFLDRYIAEKILSEFSKLLQEERDRVVREVKGKRFWIGNGGDRKMLFVPFSQDDFLLGNLGIDYLNEIIWTLIEQVNELETRIDKVILKTK